MQLLRSLSKVDTDQSNNVIMKCNLAFLPSFVDYPKSSSLDTVYVL